MLSAYTWFLYIHFKIVLMGFKFDMSISSILEGSLTFDKYLLSSDLLYTHIKNTSSLFQILLWRGFM